MTDVNKTIEDLGKAWEEFKTTNNELVKAKADGNATHEPPRQCLHCRHKLEHRRLEARAAGF